MTRRSAPPLNRFDDPEKEQLSMRTLDTLQTPAGPVSVGDRVDISIRDEIGPADRMPQRGTVHSIDADRGTLQVLTGRSGHTFRPGDFDPDPDCGEVFYLRVIR